MQLNESDLKEFILEDTEPANYVLRSCIKSFQEGNLTVPEIINVLGNLLFALGQSITGIKTSLSPKQVIALYHKQQENIGAALMVQALMLLTDYLPKAEQIEMEEK